jgi:hypothetical protein
MRIQNTIMKGCVRDDNNKGAKVEFTIVLIWYGKLLGESEKKKKKKKTT